MRVEINLIHFIARQK